MTAMIAMTDRKWGKEKTKFFFFFFYLKRVSSFRRISTDKMEGQLPKTEDVRACPYRDTVRLSMEEKEKEETLKHL